MTEVTKEQISGVHSLIKKKNIQIVDLKFNDLPGLWQHFSIPATELNGSTDPRSGIWSEGIGFDGSSIRGFQKIQESDMLLYLDTSTAVVDPVCDVPTLSIICDVFDPSARRHIRATHGSSPRRQRSISGQPGSPTPVTGGLKYEFFLFDDVRVLADGQPGVLFSGLCRGQTGTPAATSNPTSGTNRATRKDTSRFPLTTRSRT